MSQSNPTGRNGRVCGAKRSNGRGFCQSTAIFPNGRCRMHGGTSLSGAAAPAFKHGRYSKAMPPRMLERFQESMSDPDLLSLRRDLSLLDARLEDVLSRADSAESGETWRRLSATWVQFETAVSSGDQPAMMSAMSRLKSLIERGTHDTYTWDELRSMQRDRVKLVDAEQKRLTAMQQMITAEEAMALIAALIESARRIIKDPVVLREYVLDVQRIQNINRLGAGS